MQSNQREKRTKYKLATLIVLIALIFCELYFLPAKICVQDQITKLETCTISNTTSKIVWYVNKFLNDNSAYIIAAFTVALAVFTKKLVTATVKLEATTTNLVANAEDTAKRQLRAYVAVARGRVKFIEQRGEIIAKVRVRNYGQTPAYAAQGNIFIGLDKYPENDFFARSIEKALSSNKNYMTIPPKGRVVCCIRKYLTEEQIIAIRQKTHAVFVYLYVPYEDAFGNKQICARGMYARNGRDWLRDNNLSHWKEANQST